MDQKRKRRGTGISQKVWIVLAVLIVLIVIVIRLLQGHVSEQYGQQNDQEVQSAQVTVGNISTTVSGSGILAEEGIENLDIPAVVKVGDLQVKAGDTVEKGDLLAEVDSSSVILAISELQTTLDDMDDQLEEAGDDTVDSNLKTSVSGRVKKVYAKEAETVSSVMYDHGALLILSLDGYMAVDMEAAGLDAGDEVEVQSEEQDSVYEGYVKEIQNNTATVLVTDNGPKKGETVSVVKDQEVLGSGKLYIHEPLKITGYAGTVSEIEVSENDKVSAGDTLMTLTDNSYSAVYQSLLEEREKLEEIMNQLIVIYRDGGIKAPLTGTVSGIVETEDTGQTTMDNAEDSDLTEEKTILSICPNETMMVDVSVDESNILAMEVGQTVSLTIDSIGEDTFEGTVTEIGTEGTSSGGVTTYMVSVSLEKTEKMRAGMSVSASISIEGIENAKILPEEAVTKTRSQTYVYTSINEETGEPDGMVEVTTGISGGGYVEITDGLEEGDTVYYRETSNSSGFSMPGGMGGFGNMEMPDMGGNSPDGNRKGSGSFTGGAMPNRGMSGSAPQ